MKDINKNMTYIGKIDMKCECCGTYKMRGETFCWNTSMTERKLKICKRCAFRESFGTKYKQSKAYKIWAERSHNG